MAKTFIATIEGKEYELSEAAIMKAMNGAGGPQAAPHAAPGGSTLLEARLGGNTVRMLVRTLSDGRREIWIGRHRVVVELQDRRHRALAGFVRAGAGSAAGSAVRAPMPGLIRDVVVKDGDAVHRGQRLLILEAMKMENEIKAHADGIVSKCRLTPGVSVDKDQELLTITPNTEPR